MTFLSKRARSITKTKSNSSWKPQIKVKNKDLWDKKKFKAKPLDFNIINTTTPTIYTTDMISPNFDVSIHENDAKRIFSLNKEYISPKLLEYSLPSAGIPEIAFIGRSNVGKSSLIASLIDNQNIIRISKEPGCTKSVNYFGFITDSSYKNSSLQKSLTDEERCKLHEYVLYLIDLPGYGYAKVSKDSREKWKNMIDGYVCERNQTILRRTFILVDSRHGIKSTDIDMILRLNTAGAPYQIILTKSDLSTKEEKAHSLRSVFEQIFAKRQSCALPYVHLVSSVTGEGIQQLRNNITSIINYKYENDYDQDLPTLEQDDDNDNNIKINTSELNEFQNKVIDAIKENAKDEELYKNDYKILRTAQRNHKKPIY